MKTREILSWVRIALLINICVISNNLCLLQIRISRAPKHTLPSSSMKVDKLFEINFFHATIIDIYSHTADIRKYCGLNKSGSGNCK